MLGMSKRYRVEGFRKNEFGYKAHFSSEAYPVLNEVPQATSERLQKEQTYRILRGSLKDNQSSSRAYP
jgi:hypothetical protein